MMAILAVTTGQTQLYGIHKLTGRGMTFTFEADTNFDGIFDEKDKELKYDFNYAALTTRSSFSCGNLFPSILKDNGIPVMGATSGGGACAIQAMCTADGFCFQISSFRARLNTLDGDNIDGGVTPDIPIAADGTVEVKLSEGRSRSTRSSVMSSPATVLSGFARFTMGSRYLTALALSLFFTAASAAFR